MNRLDKSPLEWTKEEMAEHVGSVRQGVEVFLKESSTKKFSDLVSFMDKMFNLVDTQMFKEWTQKEFPGQLVY